MSLLLFMFPRPLYETVVTFSSSSSWGVSTIDLRPSDGNLPPGLNFEIGMLDLMDGESLLSIVIDLFELMLFLQVRGDVLNSYDNLIVVCFFFLSDTAFLISRASSSFWLYY